MIKLHYFESDTHDSSTNTSNQITLKHSTLQQLTKPHILYPSNLPTPHSHRLATANLTFSLTNLTTHHVLSTSNCHKPHVLYPSNASYSMLSN